MPGEVGQCGGCGADASDLSLLLDMGVQPLPESLGATKRYPLRLVRCLNCLLVQLDFIPDQKLVFKKSHPYATGNSGALVEHYEDLAEGINWQVLAGDLVVDIGANDGTMLGALSADLHRVGVEPTDQGKKIPEGITWEKGFFTSALARGMWDGYGPAKVITACNVLAHVPDPHDFMDGVRTLLKDDGLFIAENHDFASVSDGLQVDTVYHEHLRYYSPATFSFLLERHGFRVESIVPVPTHGGSFRTYARKVTPNFTGRAKAAATALRATLWKLNDEKKVIWGVSAATRATPLIHYAGIADFITCIAEVEGSEKIGTRIPGTTIPVTDEATMIMAQPEYAVLFAWHMADRIMPKLREVGYKGKFIIPLPEVKIVD